MRAITVGEFETGERLDAYLAQKLPEFSRTRAQKLIKDGAVALNGSPAKAHAIVKAGDAIVIKETPAEPGKAGQAPRLLPLKVVAETPDFLVVEKPPGLLVHPAPKQKTGTLVDLLLAHDPKMALVGDAPAIRPGIVHRLDRAASGLLVVARTQPMFEHLKKQFQEHAVKKEYLALVHGKVSLDHDVITTWIGRAKDKGRMVARPQPKEGDRPAVTKYDVVTRFPQATLLRVRTETGRMHQIRVHLGSIGHPIAGDTLYVPSRLRTGSIRPPRLFLHAAALGFRDLSGEWREYESELPSDLHAFLDALKKKHKK